MNIEIANRLVALRKQNGLSQEELAAKLGISRQAVSKWERAEASPDTDNLILLARLYGISLDELLFTSEPPVAAAQPSPEPPQAPPPAAASPFAPPNYPEPPRYPEPPVYQGGQEEPYSYGYAENPEPYQADDYQNAAQPPEQAYPSSVGWQKESSFDYKKFPYPVLLVFVYLVMGFFFKWWHPGWLIFLTIPLYYTLPRKNQSWMQFPYPVLVVLLFLVLGFFFHLWHPAWLLFLTVPLYYGFIAAVERR